MASDAPAADLSDGVLWQSRQDVDPRVFRSSRSGVVVGLVACVSLFVIALLGGEVAASPSLARAGVVTSRSSLEVARPPIPELLRTPKWQEERLTKDQQRLLRELDYVTRTQRRKTSSPTPPPQRRMRMSVDPFAHSAQGRGGRGDPLDGSL